MWAAHVLYVITLKQMCDAADYSQIWKTRSCAGISGKAQILFLVVFVTRYLDLVTNFISVYNTTMKVFFVGSSAATVYLMYVKFKATYDGNHDTFRCVVISVADP
jgi:ER lumen protein retaining receptor